MYFRGALALLMVVLLVASAGCSVLGTAPKPAASRGSAVIEDVFETPALPEQYIAKGPRSDSYMPIRYSSTVAMVTQRPVLQSAQHQKINGTGLSGNGTYNETIAQIVTYLTENQDYRNQTVVDNETSFWNAVAGYVRKKIDDTNPVTVNFTQDHVSPAHAGMTYSFSQVADIWDYVMPPRWTYVNDPSDGDSPFGDHFYAASETIAKGLQGDCDDFAILQAATTSVLGGNSRVVYAARESEAHMYAEAAFANATFVNETRLRYGTSDQIWYHPPYWLNLDWFNWPGTATHPGGKFYGDTDRIWVMYKDGTWEKQQKSGSNWTVILKGP
jgi:hypothetical protein